MSKKDFFITAAEAKLPKHPLAYEQEVESLAKSQSHGGLLRPGFNSKFSAFLMDTLEFNRKNYRSSLQRDVSEPQLRMSQEIQRQHKWQKMQEKLTVSAPKNYYNEAPFKPGFMFLDCLLKAPRAKITSLKVNIPESLYSSDKIYFIKTLPSGYLSCTTEINHYKFMKLIESYRTNDQNTMNKVAAVLRVPHEEPQDMQKIVMDWNQFKVKMIGSERTPWCLMQRFIKPSGARPSVTRLHYFPYKNDNKANFAYFVNSLDLQKAESASIHRCVVDMDRPETLEMFKIAGTALKPFEEVAKNIVKYLNKGYNVRIENIVLDFLRDENDVVWFCGCKGFYIDPATLSVALEPVENWWPNVNTKDSGQLLGVSKKNFSSCVHCKLCRLHYPNKELTNLISIRMYLLYQKHVEMRKELPWEMNNSKAITNDMLSQSVRVCSYCYMLVISEFELIKIEEKLAGVLNVPLSFMDYENRDSKLDVQTQFLPKVLVQWRTLLLASKLFDFASLPKSESLLLNFNFAGMVTSFPISAQPTSTFGEPCINLEMLRAHYFFSNKSSSVANFLKNFEVVISISNGRKTLAKGRGQVFSTFPPTLDSAMYETKQMVLFSERNQPMANLKLIVGLSNDHEVAREKIKVSLTKILDVYVAENSYMTSDPLPLPWMELFGAKISRNKSFGPYLEEEKFYTPTITKAEMRKMQDVPQHLTERLPPSGRIPVEPPAKNIPLTTRKPKKKKTLQMCVSQPVFIPAKKKKLLAKKRSPRSRASTRIESFATHTPKSAGLRRREKQMFIINQYGSFNAQARPSTAQHRIRRKHKQSNSMDLNK